MKKLVYTLLIALTIASCKQAPKDYVTISGKIVNANSDSLVMVTQNSKLLYNPDTKEKKPNPEYREKKIAINPDGTFYDTLKVKKRTFTFMEDIEYAAVNGMDGFLQLYLDNGFDLQVSLDGKSFRKSASFEGKGSEINTYLIKKSQLVMGLDVPATLELSKEVFYSRRDSVLRELESLTENVRSVQGTDTAFVSKVYKGSKLTIMDKVTVEYETVFQKNSLVKGAASPKFTNYENYAGGTTSLDDFKGKYVYIDFWATWCGPCKREIPFLKKIEKEYHHKNIEFVSVSIDEIRDRDKWRKMVAEKELSGVQLMADAAWKSELVTKYVITGIPWFVLIDPQGNIVNPNAPRPSDGKLKELFEELKI